MKSNTNVRNSFVCDDFVNYFLEYCVPIMPLWTSTMVKKTNVILNEREREILRNATVESGFADIKHRLLSTKNLKGADFIQKYFDSYIIPKTREFEQSSIYPGQLKYQRKPDPKRIKKRENVFNFEKKPEQTIEIKESMNISENELSRCEETWGINLEPEDKVESPEEILKKIVKPDTENWNKCIKKTGVQKTETLLAKEFNKRKKSEESSTGQDATSKLIEKRDCNNFANKAAEESEDILVLNATENNTNKDKLKTDNLSAQVSKIGVKREFIPKLTSTPIKREKRRIIGIEDLNGNGFLDGEVVDVALEMIIDRNEGNDTHLLPYHNVASLSLNNFELPLRHLHGKDIIKKNNVLALFNTDYKKGGYHWFLVDIQLRQKEVRIFNSLPECQIQEESFQTIKNLIISIHVSSNVDIDLNDYKLTVIKNTPKQTGSECGICVIENANSILQRNNFKEITDFKERRNYIMQEIENYNFICKSEIEIGDDNLNSKLQKCENIRKKLINTKLLKQESEYKQSLMEIDFWENADKIKESVANESEKFEQVLNKEKKISCLEKCTDLSIKNVNEQNEIYELPKQIHHDANVHEQTILNNEN
ncbi:UNVERIFIED_CONTAM: hypothetical protein RMT77_010722 [Armadillidium vulgare]